MSNRQTWADVVAGMTSDQKLELAERTGKSYDEVEKDLEKLRKQSEYYQRPEVKERNRQYRIKAQAKIDSLKQMLRHEGYKS